MISILVAEHLPLVRRGLVASLMVEDDFEVAADVGSGSDIGPAVHALEPDVAVINVDLPDVDGLTAATRLAERGSPCRVMILSAQPNPGLVRRAFGAGALGFMGLQVMPDQLAEGIRRIASGRRAVDSDLAVAALQTADNPLTPRELDVLRIAAQGVPSKEIADVLFLSVGTVRNHLSRIMCKTGARNRVDAVRIAADSGWL